MQSLREIFSSIQPSFKNKKEREYYTGVMKEQWSTNEEAGKSIWPDSPEDNRKVYLSRLKRSVIDGIVHQTLATKGANPFQAAYIDCWRKLAAIRILDSLGVRKGASWLARKTLSKAIKYDLTEIVCSLSTVMEVNESVSGEPREFERLMQLSDHYRELLDAENRAIRYFSILSSRFSKSKEGGQELINLTEEFLQNLKRDITRFNSFRYIYYTYNLMATHAQLTNDHMALSETCKTALEIFKNKPYPTPRSVQFSFTFKPIPAALQLKDYNAAQRYIEDALSIVESGSYNSIICLIYQAILGFHSDQLDLVTDAIRRSRVYRKYPAVEEQWKIIEAYAHLLDIETGHKFRVSRFLNDVPIYSKDKRGNNIAIIILQIMFHLKSNEKGKIIDKMETLKTYAYRYLRRDDTFRSNCFIHMLLCLPKAHFHPISLQRHARNYVNRLGTFQSGEVEIIPYEKLWKEVLRILEES